MRGEQVLRALVIKQANGFRQVVFDGGFGSRDNLDEIKELGIQDVVFSKSPGITIKEMIKRTWIYQRLRHFRAGIEGISRSSSGALAGTAARGVHMDRFARTRGAR